MSRIFYKKNGRMLDWSKIIHYKPNRTKICQNDGNIIYYKMAISVFQTIGILTLKIRKQYL